MGGLSYSLSRISTCFQKDIVTEKPLRAEEERSQILQAEIEALKVKFEDDKERLNDTFNEERVQTKMNFENEQAQIKAKFEDELEQMRTRFKDELEQMRARILDLQAQLEKKTRDLEKEKEASESLEIKLDRSLEKSNETYERIGELEQAMRTEREESKEHIKELELELFEARAAHAEELKFVRDAANQSAIEHMAVLNKRQEMIDELQDIKREMDQEADDAKDEIFCLQEDKTRIEDSLETYKTAVADTRVELRAAMDKIEKAGAEKTNLQISLESTGQELIEVRSALEEHKLTVKQKLEQIDCHTNTIEQLLNDNGRQKEEISALEGIRNELHEKVQELEKAIEKTLRDGEKKCADMSAELASKHDLEV